MQSEIDEIRHELQTMAHLNVQQLLDRETIEGFINRIGDRLGLIELQQADLVVKVPVFALDDIGRRVRQDRPRHLTLLVGGVESRFRYTIRPDASDSPVIDGEKL